MTREPLKVIVGLGETGLSCARYFHRAGVPFSVMDHNPSPSRLDDLRELSSDIEFSGIDADKLLRADEIVVSPGVPLATPEIRAAVEAGVPVTGDVAIFANTISQPLIAITGSNGKSTVTALVGLMARDQGIATGIGGNIGTPCLDLLDRGYDLFVLEISSYQLETANPLPCETAVLLNLSPDHLDRYVSVEDYYRTKAGIYMNCEKAVVNRDIAFDLDIRSRVIYSFGLTAPQDEFELGVLEYDDDQWLGRDSQRLIRTDELGIKGRHNHANALAALAIGYAMEFDEATMLATLSDFNGLEHRCEYLGVHAGMSWFNDSKSTNTGSTLAAIEGLSGDRRNMILILGGIDKGADFSELAPVVSRYVKLLLVYGRDASKIAAALQANAPTFNCDDLAEVIGRAIEFGDEGDQVLFSPGCSSFDMFDNFEHRGRMFKALLKETAL